MSLSQTITLICILAVGFVSIAHFFLQDAYGGADLYEYDAYEVYSWATQAFVEYEIVSGGASHTDHYTYYHYPGSSTTAWEHYQAWPSGHPDDTDYNAIGRKWIP